MAEDAKPATAVTFSAIVVLADKVPRLPTRVRLYRPGATLAVTLMVAVEVELVGFGANVAVMPVGQPDSVNSTID